MGTLPPVEDDGSGVRCTWVKPAFCIYFYGPPTKERIEFMFEHEKRWVGTARFNAITIVDIRAGKEINAEARQRAKEISEHWATQQLVSVTVVEGSGFFPALVRGVVASVQLLSKAARMDIRVAATVDEAVKLCAKASQTEGITFDEGDVTKALEALVLGAPQKRAS
jgi:hypothetical protein